MTLRLLGPTWRLLLVFVTVLVLTLPHVGHLWKPEAVGGFASGSPTCDAPWRGGVSEWHECQSGLLWFDQRPRPTYAIEGVATLGGAVTSIGLGLALLGCLVLLRDGLRAARCREPV